ncbi:MAG: hypothetical protein RSC76_04020 [Oscillospiraceae bacterium]
MFSILRVSQKILCKRISHTDKKQAKSMASPVKQERYCPCLPFSLSGGLGDCVGSAVGFCVAVGAVVGVKPFQQILWMVLMTCTNPVRYYMSTRGFEVSELKLLVDSIRAFRFISKGNRAKLIKKLEHFCSKPQLRELHERDYILYEQSSVKKAVLFDKGTSNKRLADGGAIDKIEFINRSIQEDKCISFTYSGYVLSTKTNADGTVKIRHRNKRSSWISPFRLAYMDGDYFLIRITYAAQKENQMMKVELLCKNTILDSILERFGEDIPITRVSKVLFRIKPLVIVNDQFIVWVLGFGADMRGSEPRRKQQAPSQG